MTRFALTLAEKPIKITFPDGKQKDAVAFKDTPMDLALAISKQLAGQIVVAKVQ